MNKLPLAKRTQILSMLCEGIVHAVDRARRRLSRFNTVDKLLRDAGAGMRSRYHDRAVRGVKSAAHPMR